MKDRTKNVLILVMENAIVLLEIKVRIHLVFSTFSTRRCSNVGTTVESDCIWQMALFPFPLELQVCFWVSFLLKWEELDATFWDVFALARTYTIPAAFDILCLQNWLLLKYACFQDPNNSNTQYSLLSVPKQRPIVDADSLVVSAGETLTDEQVHLIDKKAPVLNTITCKSRTEKNEFFKVCNSLHVRKEVPRQVLVTGSEQPKSHS